MLDNHLTFLMGPAGSGKTHLAVGMACKQLKENKVEKIVLSRPAVDAGASIGYLPGDMLEKVAPYLIPLKDELGYFINKKMIDTWIECGRIEVVPLPFMRGRTFINSFVILDEAQNATCTEITNLLTRIGLHSQMVLVGDPTQSDLQPRDQGAFQAAYDHMGDIDGIARCELSPVDIVRHHLIPVIVERLRNAFPVKVR